MSLEDFENEPELYVVDLKDFLKTLSEIKKEVRANVEYTNDFKRGSDFVCEFLLDNYGEVLDELVNKKTHKLN